MTKVHKTHDIGKPGLLGAGGQVNVPQQADKISFSDMKAALVEKIDNVDNLAGKIFSLAVLFVLVVEFLALAYGASVMARDLVPAVPFVLSMTVFSVFMLLNAANFALNKWMWGFWTTFFVCSGLHMLREDMLPFDWSIASVTLLVTGIVIFHLVAGATLRDMRE